MRVRFSTLAESDLDEIGEYIAHDSPIAAVQFLIEVRKAAFALADYPERFPVRFERRGKAVRCRVIDSYAIYYFTDGDFVQVTRVVHGARDHERLLFPEN